MAGLKFHSFVDEAREKFFASKNIYSSYSDCRYLIESQKFLDDTILYCKINNWKEIIDFFDEIAEEELSFGIQKNDIMKWHRILQKYLSRQPDDSTRSTLLVDDIRLPLDIINELNSNIGKMKDDQKIVQSIYEMYDEFLN